MAIIGANFSRNQTAATLRNEIIDDLMTLSDMAMHDEGASQDTLDCEYCCVPPGRAGWPIAHNSGTHISITHDSAGSYKLGFHMNVDEAGFVIKKKAGWDVYRVGYEYPIDYCPKCGRRLT